MIVIIMGVSGSGKTTIGERLAERLGWPFYDGDDFHPPANRDKMARGIALTDADRAPWLAALRDRIDELSRAGRPAVIACSALKRAYREMLSVDRADVRLVYLKGDYDLIRRRMETRAGHFMNVDLLMSQFDTLEEPANALVVDASQPSENIVDLIEKELNKEKHE